MTDIKEPINTTSDGTFLSVVCNNPEKSVVGQKLGGPQPPRNYPPAIENDPARFLMGTIFLVMQQSSYFFSSRHARSS